MQIRYISGNRSSVHVTEHSDVSKHTLTRRSRSRSKNSHEGHYEKSESRASIIAHKQHGSYFHADEFYIKKLNEILFSDSLSIMPSKPTKLLNHLFIGNYRDAQYHAHLNRLGITHVLNCAAGHTHHKHRQRFLTVNNDVNVSPYPRSTGIHYYKPLNAHDTSQYPITNHLQESRNFIDHAKRRRGRVFVHCVMGVNRSGFICVAYMMIDQQMNLLEAFQYVRNKHGPIVCNRGFQKQLIALARAHALLKP